MAQSNNGTLRKLRPPRETRKRSNWFPDKPTTTITVYLTIEEKERLNEEAKRRNTFVGCLVSNAIYTTYPVVLVPQPETEEATS